jgi:hypothetical protein
MIDWSSAQEGVVEEALRTSETFLAGTVTIAASADQRAAVVAGTFATAGAAIVAGVIGFSAAVPANSEYAASVYVGGLSAAFMFLLGALLCIQAAMPVGLNLPGTQPSGWETDVKGRRALRDCQHDLLNFRETLILENLAVIKNNARLFMWGSYCGIAATFVGAAAWFITFKWSNYAFFLAAFFEADFLAALLFAAAFLAAVFLVTLSGGFTISRPLPSIVRPAFFAPPIWSSSRFIGRLPNRLMRPSLS